MVVGQGVRVKAAAVAHGTLTYSFVESLQASHPGFIVRALGGAIFASGMLFMAYNVWRTVRASNPVEAEAASQIAVVGAH